jgi:hypothetical protein
MICLRKRFFRIESFQNSCFSVFQIFNAEKNYFWQKSFFLLKNHSFPDKTMQLCVNITRKKFAEVLLCAHITFYYFVHRNILIKTEWRKSHLVKHDNESWYNIQSLLKLREYYIEGKKKKFAQPSTSDMVIYRQIY